LILNKSTKEWSKIRICNPDELALLDLGNQEKLIEKLNRSNIVKINEFKTYVEIETFAYVGRLQVGNLEITINPKIDNLPFLQLIDYTFDLNIIQHFPETHQSLGAAGFIELLLFGLSIEIERIIKRGLFKQYISINENMNSIKGRIDFNRLIKTTSSLSSNLPCSYFNRIENNLLNQILLAGGLYAQSLSRNNYIRNNYLKNLSLIQKDIQKTDLNNQIIRSASSQLNRLNNNYDRALKLINLVYNSSGILFDDSDEQIILDGFLFNMNSFFQRLITKFLCESLIGYIIQSEKNIPNFYRYLPDYNPKKKQNPLPRPDIMLKKKDTTVIFIDTKYIDLWDKKIPSYILYQLSIYVLSLNEPLSKAIILYPTILDEASDSIIEIINPINALIKSYVIIRPVKILTLLKLITDNNSKERIEYAKCLVDVSF